MSSEFWKLQNVIDYSPFGRSTILNLVNEGIIPAFKNPLISKKNTSLIFIPDQVKQAFYDMSNTQTQNRKEKNANSSEKK